MTNPLPLKSQGDVPRFTPGPLKVWPRQEEPCSLAGFVTVRARDGVPIAYVFGDDDASLYAAAPDLAEYVRARMLNGCCEAERLWEKLNGRC